MMSSSRPIALGFKILSAQKMKRQTKMERKKSCKNGKKYTIKNI